MAQTIKTIETPTRQHDIITRMMNGQTHESIATALNISRSTLERDLKKFLADEYMMHWFKEQWLIRYGARINKDPGDVEVFRALTQLIKRSSDLNLVQNNVSQIRVVFGDNLTIVEAEPVKKNIANEQSNQEEDSVVSSDTVNE